ncbi:hypothetical protein LAV73_13785 [Lysinibacillus xylanilyticus]|uniref:hypothetical protein n=1 Tax=Lysinibacillus xylanilyticus TaxID=582475 RepID=UPI002B240AD8|nr:hypothetical protein [Lysinibacillus xylanilyticus]MEB2281061.1 hypothetical protein [Lysinibacillus xylanilyticus]
MKISKVFAGLVVCGALIFPGTLSSSAQEIEPSESPKSINYSTKQETNLSITKLRVTDNWYVSEEYSSYQGSYVNVTKTRKRDAPYAPYVYTGKLFYIPSESTTSKYVYGGTLTLQN